MSNSSVSSLVAICVSTIVLFDVAAYFFVPSSYTGFSPDYRDVEVLVDRASLQADSERDDPSQPQSVKEYPRDYFEADKILGFDIRPGASTIARFAEGKYPIFSNELGCFDKNKLSDFQKSEQYVYFAGDSFTWGYSRYEKKFPTIWEQHSRMLTAKCGVTNTGQLHQFEKFKRVASRIGSYPKVVFVGMFPNDPANDLAYPHTTVISGYLVDTAYLRGSAIVRPSMGDLTSMVESSLREYEHMYKREESAWTRLKTYLKVYSLSANLLQAWKRYAFPSSQPSHSASAKLFGETVSEAFTYAEVKSLYLKDDRAARSRTVIKEWAEHAKANGYQLVFLLIPRKEYYDDIEYFSQVKEWLDLCGVDYLDFTIVFKKRGFTMHDVFWRIDGHLSEDGNQIVGDELFNVTSNSKWLGNVGGNP